jgi:tRNA(fMet)-specific endonuclease VapC
LSLLLLDTSAYSHLARGHAGVRDRLRAAREIGLSVVVLGELLHGFRGGQRFEGNVADLERFRSNPRVRTLLVTVETADRFARVMAQLRRSGTPIPTNDAWIAAQALETGAEILTFDADLERVHGVVVTRLAR